MICFHLLDSLKKKVGEGGVVVLRQALWAKWRGRVTTQGQQSMDGLSWCLQGAGELALRVYWPGCRRLVEGLLLVLI